MLTSWALSVTRGCVQNPQYAAFDCHVRKDQAQFDRIAIAVTESVYAYVYTRA